MGGCSRAYLAELTFGSGDLSSHVFDYRSLGRDWVRRKCSEFYQNGISR